MKRRVSRETNPWEAQNPDTLSGNHNGQRPNGAMRPWWSLFFVSTRVRIYCPHYKTFPTGLFFDPLDSPAAHVNRGAPRVPETQIPQRG